MFPLKDLNPNRTVPIVTWLFVLINGAAFGYETHLWWQFGGGLNSFIESWGCTPHRVLSEHSVEAFATLFTSMFLHGGWVHILGNMWFLLLFGDNVEDRLGHLGYFFFYLLGGLGAILGQILADPHSTVPCIGASGCIAAVLGAYIVLWPHAKVLTFNPIMDLGILGDIYAVAYKKVLIRIPAFFFLGYWFALQWIAGVAQLTHLSGQAIHGGVAWWAHIGGFVTGLITVVLPQGPELPEDPESAMQDPMEKLDIPKSWAVTPEQLNAVVPRLADLPPLPGWFFSVMAVTAAAEFAVLAVLVVRYPSL